MEAKRCVGGRQANAGQALTGDGRMFKILVRDLHTFDMPADSTEIRIRIEEP